MPSYLIYIHQFKSQGRLKYVVFFTKSLAAETKVRLGCFDL